MNPQRKKLAMMKAIRFLSMAALVFVGLITTGCSTEDDNKPLDMPESKTFTLTTTISMDGSAPTRALTADGVKTFAVNDQIAVVYTNTSDKRVVAMSNALQAGDITNGGKSAKMTVTLENPVAGSVDYIYPASMAKSDGSPNYSALCMQDGTLANLASKLDYAKGSGDMTGSGSEYTLPSIALKNQLAICQFKIKDGEGTEITSSITGLTVSDGTNTYTVSREAAAGPIYLAMQPVSSDKIISFVANSTSNSYYKSVTMTSKALEANNLYPINVTMITGNVIDLSELTTNCTAQNGDMLTGKLGASHKISIAAGATVILKNVSINYDENPILSGEFAGINCLGNATLIISGTENLVKGFSSGYPGIFVPSGSTLTITGSSTLYANGHANAAGIGSSRNNIEYYRACGNIVIQGGTIWAFGGSGAAAIGSGASGNYTEYETPQPQSSCGYITIKNSVTNVYVPTESGGSNIGPGQNSACGTVTIEDRRAVHSPT